MSRRDEQLDSEIMQMEQGNFSKSRPYDLTGYTPAGLMELLQRRPDLEKEIRQMLLTHNVII